MSRASHPRINATKKGVLKVGWIGVVKGTKNAAAAMHFINAYLDEEFQLGFAKNTGVWPVEQEGQCNACAPKMRYSCLSTTSIKPTSTACCASTTRA